ncbi:Sec63 Brl domain-containing protein [Chytridium lagenaria]|nr:Sec63 Brl domain-containing protein [Chytridium lagenaria]
MFLTIVLWLLVAIGFPIFLFRFRLGRPRAVRVSTVTAANEGQPRRSIHSPQELVSKPSPDVSTIYDILLRSSRLYPNKNILGARSLVRIVEEEKEVVKVVANVETKEMKKWKFFELSKYQWLNFTEVSRFAHDVGAGFRALGLKSGDKVTLFASTSRDWILVALSCFTQNFTITTAYDTLVTTLFTNADLLPMISKIAPLVKTLKNVIYNGDAKKETLDSLTKSFPHLKLISLQDLRKLGVDRPADPVPPKADDIACSEFCNPFNSSSFHVHKWIDRKPKGVMLAHSNIVAGIAGARFLVRDVLGSEEYYLAYLPLAHVLEFTVELLCLHEGISIGYGTVKTLTDASVRNCLGDIRELRPTLMAGVPLYGKGVLGKLRDASELQRKIFNLAFELKWGLIQLGLPTFILDAIVFNKIKNQTGGRLKFALSGGAPIPKSTQKFLSNIDQYSKLGVVGPPVPSGEVKLVDVPDTSYSSKNRPGLRQPEVTKETLTEDGWLMTGDIGEWQPDGNLSIIDRKKNLVKLSNGEYIALEKLESVYKISPFVQNVLIYGDSEQNFCVAIVQPIDKELSHYLASKNITPPRGGEEGGLKPAEIVGAVYVAGEEWTPQNGLFEILAEIWDEPVFSGIWDALMGGQSFMALDQVQRNQQYQYTANSNLVLHADRSALPRRDQEPSGEPESLYGRIDVKRFGDRAMRTIEEKKEQSAKKRKEREEKMRAKGAERQAFKKSKKEASSNAYGYNSVLAATEDFEGDIYRPRTKETRQAYELINPLSPNDVIETLKDDTKKDFDRKREVEEIINFKLASEKFNQLVNLGKRITDFRQEDVEGVEIDDGSAAVRKEDMDEEYGVAVVFDEEEEEEGSDDDEYEVREDDVQDEDEMYGQEASTGNVLKTGEEAEDDEDKDVGDDDFTTVVAQGGKDRNGGGGVQTGQVNPHDVDSFWLQRQIASCYPDPHVTQTKTMLALEILSPSRTARDCENELMAFLSLAPTRKAEGRSRRGVVEGAMEMEVSEDKKKAATIAAASAAADGVMLPRTNIDLESLIFEQGGHLMSNKKCKLPEGSFKRTKKGYEEIHVPAPKTSGLGPGEKLVEVGMLPEWARPAFKNAKSLNRIQSKVYPVAFKEDANMLLCAPTGAGKTNCAVLTILREVGKHRNAETGEIDLDAFKIIYIAPMKALVAEMVGNFGERLKPYNIRVAELTGDRQLTKAQIAETQIIVTTPEKWDVITRKATDRSYTNLVRLLIIDEIHLLHDDRGPVLESVVSRTIRLMEQTQQPVRLVGLSATLPNYHDVAVPCPLKQQYIGITEKKAIKRFQLMNEITYEKLMEEAGKNQVLIFCHSRKETARTAKALRDMCLEKETLARILKQDAASREILQTESASVKNMDLQDVLPYGFAIHHAGMSRPDRTLVEDLFAGGHVQVLISTATLAWGVNLPAHTVIIKGTQIYSPEKGRWTELSPQDGIIITTHTELQYYLSLLNQQLPIESQFVSRLADNLNAEIVLGTIRSRDEAVQWLGYTYLYVRMLRNGALYGVTADEAEDDKLLEQKRVDLIHSAATVLDKSNLVKYDRKTGKFQVTELGRIASHYYITHGSMSNYNQHLKPSMGIIDLFRVFALSSEFKFIPVREEEKLELSKLMDRVPIPVKETIEEPTAKINVLLQAYISQLKLEGFALMADMEGWAQLARKSLDVCKMVDKRMWLSMSPLRQFKNVRMDIVQKLERKDIPWDRYYDLNPHELGELAGMPKAGKDIHRLVHQFPKLELHAQVQPITRSLLKFDEKASGGTAESFWILVEDVDSEVILYQDVFLLKQRYMEDEHTVSFTVPMFEPLPPNYFVSLVSDRWLHCETRLPISFKNLILPEKYPPHTELLDLQPLPTSALRKKDTAGSGKTICAEFALLRMWTLVNKGRAVYIAPYEDVVELKAAEWQQKFGKIMGGKNIVALTGESAADLKLLEKGDVVFATPTQWDMISRRWKQRKNVQTVNLFIVDEVHLIGGDIGPTIEVIVSRMRYIETQTESKIRIVALGASLANARDLGEWIGATPHSIFNFHPNVRPVPLEIHIQGYNVPHFPSLMIAMTKPAYLAIKQMAGRKPVIVFPEELETHLKSLQDRYLAELVEHGVAFYHEALSKSDKRIVERLYSAGAIQVVVASRETCWSIPMAAHLVIVMGTQQFLGKEHRYTDYLITDVLQMMGRASRPRHDESGKCVLMCQASHLDHALHDHFNAEVVTKTIANKQDAVDYLTWTFFYRRMTLNPNYYACRDELEELMQSKCILIEDDDVSPLNLGMIAAYYYINYVTVELFSMSLKERTKLRGLLEIVSAAAEFEDIPIRHHEDGLLKRLHDRVPVKVDLTAAKWSDPHVKTNILLQSHFSRIGLPPDLESDQKVMLQRVLRLVQACVDVVSTSSWLAPCLSAMEMSQMCVQAVWDRDPWLKQVPHVTQGAIERLKEKGVTSVVDLLDMEDEDRDSCLQVDRRQMVEIANYCNRYPNVDLAFEVSAERASAGESVVVKVVLERVSDDDEEEDDEGGDDAMEVDGGKGKKGGKKEAAPKEEVGPVIAPYFPGKKDEGWWVVVGHKASNALLAIKRTTLQQKASLKLDFTVPKPPEGGAKMSFKIYLMCDAYMGVDQEYDFEMDVMEGEEEESEEESGDDESEDGDKMKE